MGMLGVRTIKTSFERAVVLVLTRFNFYEKLSTPLNIFVYFCFKFFVRLTVVTHIFL